MRRRPEPLGLVLVAVAGLALAAEEPGHLFDPGGRLEQGEPITVTSDTLEYDYKANVVVYRGDVLARQGHATVRSDRLIVTLAQGKDGNQAAVVGEGGVQLRQIEAVGGVRIDYGTSWATGGRAVFDQNARTFVLTDDPVLHDGSNEVAGERVVVYLDEERSVVEGGRKRVKAVLYPDGEGKPAPTATGTDAATLDAAAAAPDTDAATPDTPAAAPDAAARPKAGSEKTAAVEEPAVAPAATRVPRSARRRP